MQKKQHCEIVTTRYRDNRNPFPGRIPGIAIITSTSQSATYDGGDTNAVIQANPADVTVPVTLGK